MELYSLMFVWCKKVKNEMYSNFPLWFVSFQHDHFIIISSFSRPKTHLRITDLNLELGNVVGRMLTTSKKTHTHYFLKMMNLLVSSVQSLFGELKRIIPKRFFGCFTAFGTNTRNSRISKKKNSFCCLLFMCLHFPSESLLLPNLPNNLILLN